MVTSDEIGYLLGNSESGIIPTLLDFQSTRYAQSKFAPLSVLFRLLYTLESSADGSDLLYRNRFSALLQCRTQSPALHWYFSSMVS